MHKKFSVDGRMQLFLVSRKGHMKFGWTSVIIITSGQLLLMFIRSLDLSVKPKTKLVDFYTYNTSIGLECLKIEVLKNQTEILVYTKCSSLLRTHLHYPSPAEPDSEQNSISNELTYGGGSTSVNELTYDWA